MIPASLVSVFCLFMQSEEDVLPIQGPPLKGGFVLKSEQDQTGIEKPSSKFAREGNLESDLMDPMVSFEDDGHFASFGTHLIIDAIKYGHANERRSGIQLDRATLVAERGLKDVFTTHLELDLLGVDTPRNLWELWAEWLISEDASLKMGQMRVALGSEFATSIPDFPIAGYGYTSYLDGRYDWAIRGDTQAFEEALWVEGVATLGAGFGLEGRRRSEPQFSGRAVVHPFGWAENWTNGLFVGGAYAMSPRYESPLVLTTPLQSRVFETRDIDGDSAHFRHLELGLTSGPFRCGVEHVCGEINGVNVQGQERDFEDLTSWSAYAAFNITGETQRWSRGRWLPDATEDVSPYGRFEVGARYSKAELDRELFSQGIASFDPSTQEVRTFTLNATWYALELGRITLGWVKTLADDELLTFGGTNRDSSYFLRIEIAL